MDHPKKSELFGKVGLYFPWEEISFKLTKTAIDF